MTSFNYLDQKMKTINEHFNAMLSVVVRDYNFLAWKTANDENGEPFKGDCFYVGIDTPNGLIGYIYHLDYWDLFDCKVLAKSPKIDFDELDQQDMVSKILKLNREDAIKYFIEKEKEKLNTISKNN